MILAKVFKENLRAAVKAHPLPTKAICHKAGYNYAYVRKVMSGSRTNPTLQFVESMAGAMGLTAWDLLKETGGQHD